MATSFKINSVHAQASQQLKTISFDLPLVVWIMRGFMKQIPKDMEAAPLVDCCTRLQAFLSIALPMPAAGLAATITFCFVQETCGSLAVGKQEFLAQLPRLTVCCRACFPEC
jgi:ABC-type maltose transport system permease subunit